MKHLLLLTAFAFSSLVASAQQAYTVTDNGDNGTAGQLRTLVQSAVSGDTILIPAGMVITVDFTTNGRLVVEDTLTIIGQDYVQRPIIDLNSGESMYVGPTSTWLHMENVELRNGNHPASGGALNFTPFSIVKLKNCRFYNNTCFDFGGAVSGTNLLRTEIEDCIFEDNQATGNTGALYMDGNFDTVFIDRCSFVNNQSAVGGGAMWLKNIDIAYVRQSTFFLNNTSNNGGAVYMQTQTDHHFYNCTFIDNQAGGSGDHFYFNQGNLTMRNCILGQSPSDAMYIGGAGNLYTEGGNVVNDGSILGVYTNSNDLENTDPLLQGPFRTDNGHFVFTPGCGSPAIDNGLNGSFELNSDQAYQPHLVGKDAGAIESGYNTTTRTVTNNGDSILGGLRERIAASCPSDTIVFNLAPQDTIVLINEIIWPHDLYIDGPGMNQLAITTLGTSRHFDTRNATFPSTIDDLTLMNGVANASPDGGGSIITNIMLNLYRVRFYNNYSVDHGGAIQAPSGSPTNIYDCWFDQNISVLDGGAIWTGGAINIYRTSFSGNTANGHTGGVHQEVPFSTTNIINCTFYDNHAFGAGSNYGGALTSRNGNSIRLNLYHCSFDGNTGSTVNDVYYSHNTGSGLWVKNSAFNSVNPIGGTPIISESGNVTSNAMTGSTAGDYTFQNLDFQSPVVLNDLLVLPLGCNSQAVDRALYQPEPNDQIGQSQYGAQRDAGAYERQFGQPSATITGTAVLCASGSAVGQLDLTFNGVAPFTVVLTNGTQQFTATYGGNAGTYTPTASGTYTIVSVQDANCQGLGTGSGVATPSTLAASMSVSPASCGQSNGSATVTPTGGSAPYDIAWTSGDSTVLADDLSAGLYQTTITDAMGCQVTATASVSNADINLSHTMTEPSCHGTSDGSIDLTVSGASPFSYDWTTGAITQDVSNLPAGTYDVEVTDNNGCVATASIAVGEPDAIDLTGLEEMATCGTNDGLAAVYATGGTMPYTYQWFDDMGPILSATDDSLQNITAGTYNVLVTDDNGCQDILNAVIGETGGPTVTVDTITQPGCATLGEISVNVPGTIDSLRWSNGATSATITGLDAGYYTVRVYENGCMSLLGVDLESTVPSGAEICLVTVDFTTFTNKVVWGQQSSNEISHYNIYRETSQLGQFLIVGSVPYTSLSQYTDPVANPTTRSWRYKVTLVDTCGNESALSPYHKTIHLTKSLAVSPPGAINLVWDDYEGFTYNQFRIWRYSDVDGWNVIDSVTSATHMYTDTSAASLGWTVLDYFIEVDAPGTCTAERAENYNSSRSNKTDPSVAGPIGLKEEALNTLTVFPNPATGALFIRLGEMENARYIHILDAQGRKVQSLRPDGLTTRTDVSDWAPGVYFVVVQTDSSFLRRSVVIH